MKIPKQCRKCKNDAIKEIVYGNPGHISDCSKIIGEMNSGRAKWHCGHCHWEWGPKMGRYNTNRTKRGEIRKAIFTFNGYNYCGGIKRCGYLANRMVKEYKIKKKFIKYSTADLMSCIFYEGRRAHFGIPPNRQYYLFLIKEVEKRLTEK
ncbi:MAG TPA: hypothetical protein P5056_00205 [Candidatus Paceibacterota bacterium]|nr:hypothetical protein [Candidatus Paceibacterota bacterium]